MEVLAPDTRSDLDRAGVIRKGHFAFPSGYHCSKYFSFAALRESEEGKEVSHLLAHRFLRLAADWEYDYILTHGFQMSDTAAKAASVLAEADRDVDIIHAVGFQEIHVLGSKRELAGQRCVVFIDVLNSGRLLERLSRAILREGGCVVGVVTVVDFGSYGGELRSVTHAMLTESVRSHILAREECPKCELQVPVKYVDLDRQSASESRRSWSRVEDLQLRLQDMFGGDEEFWSIAADAKAIRRHLVSGDYHLTPAVSEPDLLGDEKGRNWIRKQSLDFITRLSRSGIWPIVCAPRAEPAIGLATVVQQLAGDSGLSEWPLIEARYYEGRIRVPETAALARERRALVVDVGTSSGNTLIRLSKLLRTRGVEELAAMVIVDRCSDEERAKIEEHYVAEYVGLVRSTLPIHKTEDADECPACWRRAVREKVSTRVEDALLRAYMTNSTFRSPGKDKEQARAAQALSYQQGDLFEPIQLCDMEAVLFAISVRGDAGGEEYENAILYCLGSEDISVRHRRALIDMLPKEALESSAVSWQLQTFARNSVPPTLLEAACNALARGRQFDWLDEGWLSRKASLLEQPLEKGRRPRWMFLAYVLWMAREHDAAKAQSIAEKLAEARDRCVVGSSRRDTLGHLLDVLGDPGVSF